jgi:histone H3
MPRAAKGVTQDEPKSSKKKVDESQQLGVAVPVDSATTLQNELAELKKHKAASSKRKQPSPTKLLASAGVKKPHRFRPGTVVAREIKHQQKSTNTIIPRRPFDRLVREIIQDVALHNADSMRIQKSALDALHAASEDCLIDLFTKTSDLTHHKGKVTIFPRDMRLVAKLDGKMARSLREYVAQIEYDHREKTMAIISASKREDLTGVDKVLQKKDHVTKVDPAIGVKPNITFETKA